MLFQRLLSALREKQVEVGFDPSQQDCGYKRFGDVICATQSKSAYSIAGGVHCGEKDDGNITVDGTLF